jgi:hypothetical protein
MATTSNISTTPTYGAPFLQPFGNLLANYTVGQLQQPTDISGLMPQVAGQNVLQQQALQQQATQAGLGSLQFNDQGQILGAGQGTGIAGYQPYLQGAAGLSSPGAYQQYMSPYQQDVIDTTLSNYDVQAQKGIAPLSAQAVGSGAFGGARQGVQKAEYQSASDRNRAALEAQLRQQGFSNAQNQANIGFGQQTNLAQLQPILANQGIQQLGGAGNQAQTYSQNILNAMQQGNQLQQQYPWQQIQNATGIFGALTNTPGTPGAPLLTTPGLEAAQAMAGILGSLGTTGVGQAMTAGGNIAGQIGGGIINAGKKLMNIGGKLYDMATGQEVNTGETGNQTGNTGTYDPSTGVFTSTPTPDSTEWSSWIDNWGGG